MIQVHLHGPARITLKGHALKETVTKSMISLHPGPNGPRWQLTLVLPHFPLIQVENLETAQVIPAMRVELSNHYVDEEIHTLEIRYYMDLIWREFGPNGKHALQTYEQAVAHFHATATPEEKAEWDAIAEA